jgi:choline kinase
LTGLVLAAGAGRRLHPLTTALPKTLLPLADGRTILDLALANFRAVGIERVVVVTGFAAERVEAHLGGNESRHGLEVELVFNDRAEEWNNAYSLWLAREAFRDGVLLANGDTVHPSTVEEALLTAPEADLVLAVDDQKSLGDEEMKVVVSGDGAVERISKEAPPAAAEGEYIGVARIAPAAAVPISITRTVSRSSSAAEPRFA